MLQAVPLSQLYGMKVTKRDIVEPMYNGPRANEIAARGTRVIETYPARFTEGATPQLTQGPRGSQLLTGRQAASAAGTE